MTERTKVTLTEKMINSAFEHDPSLGKPISRIVISLFFEGRTFVQTESGGWRGEGGVYSESTVLSRVLENALRSPEEQTPEQSNQG